MDKDGVREPEELDRVEKEARDVLAPLLEAGTDPANRGDSCWAGVG